MEVKYNYSISTHASDYSGFWTVTLDAIAREYARQGRAIPESIREINAHGCRYSYQDYDVLSAAVRDLAGSNYFLPLVERIGTFKGR